MRVNGEVGLFSVLYTEYAPKMRNLGRLANKM